MKDFAEVLGKAYAIEVGHDVQETVLIDIQNINTLADYAAVSQLLEGLLPVRHLAVRVAEPGQVLLELVVQGGVDRLVPSLRLQRQLRAVPQRAPLARALEPEDQLPEAQPIETVLNYRWFGGE